MKSNKYEIIKKMAEELGEDEVESTNRNEGVIKTEYVDIKFYPYSGQKMWKPGSEWYEEDKKWDAFSVDLLKFLAPKIFNIGLKNLEYDSIGAIRVPEELKEKHDIAKEENTVGVWWLSGAFSVEV